MIIIITENAPSKKEEKKRLFFHFIWGKRFQCLIISIVEFYLPTVTIQSNSTSRFFHLTLYIWKYKQEAINIWSLFISSILTDDFVYLNALGISSASITDFMVAGTCLCPFTYKLIVGLIVEQHLDNYTLIYHND